MLLGRWGDAVQTFSSHWRWLLISLVWFGTSAAAQETSSTVRVKIVDDVSNAATPAMVCITDAVRRTTWVPGEARPGPKPNSTNEFRHGIVFSPDKNWVGPVRKTNGIGDNHDRSYVYGEVPSLPFWSEPVMYQVSGDFSIRLPRGDYRIAVSRGMEFVPVLQVFQVDDPTVDVTVNMRRWIDLADEGWYSGDVHVHHPTTETNFQNYLLAYAEAEDVRIVNVLEQHHHAGFHSKQLGFGQKFRRQKNGRWLVSGQEAPSSTFGHIIGLNIEHLAYDHRHEDFYDFAFRDIHKDEGALVGYAHFAWNGCDLPRGFPWYVATGKIDFVELLQFTKLNSFDYYDYLNLGFRLAAAAGSDIPWGSTLGEVRTYVFTGDEFDPDRWFEALAEGHSFVTNGPALDFTVDGQLPGSTINLDQDADLDLFVRARCHPRIGSLKVLRIVSNEGVLKEMTPSRSEQELAIRDSIRIERSRWLVASAECENGAVAHSSPIYTIVDGRPHWSPKRSQELINKQLAAMKLIEDEFADGSDSRHRGIRKRLAKARAFYVRLRKAMESGQEMPAFWTAD